MQDFGDHGVEYDFSFFFLSAMRSHQKNDTIQFAFKMIPQAAV